jgi:hypothetical protein
MVHASLSAAPVDPPVPNTLRERVGMSDRAIIGRLLPSEKPSSASTELCFEIVKTIRKPPGDETSEPGRRIVVRESKPDGGKLFLVTGKARGNGEVAWASPLPISQESIEYISQVCHLGDDNLKTILYCMSRLESQDDAVSTDVHAELSTASLNDLASVAEAMPRNQLKLRFVDDASSFRRKCIYGLMLGFCGDHDTRELLKRRVLEDHSEQQARDGLELMICGYILADRENGLNLLSEHKFSNDNVPYHDGYASLLAIKMVSHQQPDRIDRGTMRRALYELLNRKDFGNLAIVELTQLQDWSSQSRIADLYRRAHGYSEPEEVRRAVVRYMQACSISVERDGTVPDHAERAAEFLKSIDK